jgi:hypothetical protein
MLLLAGCAATRNRFERSLYRAKTGRLLCSPKPVHDDQGFPRVAVHVLSSHGSAARRGTFRPCGGRLQALVRSAAVQIPDS